MNEINNKKSCAPTDNSRGWASIDWNKAEAAVKKLQVRIVKSAESR